MKYRNVKVFSAFLFALFAVVQYNDPDSWLWIFIYASMAIISFLSAFKEIANTLIYVAILGILVYALILLPEIFSWINQGMPSITGSMKAEDSYIEYAREFFGLLISLITLIGIRKTNQKKAL